MGSRGLLLLGPRTFPSEAPLSITSLVAFELKWSVPFFSLFRVGASSHSNQWACFYSLRGLCTAVCSQLFSHTAELRKSLNTLNIWCFYWQSKGPGLLQDPLEEDAGSQGCEDTVPAKITGCVPGSACSETETSLPTAVSQESLSSSQCDYTAVKLA